jgi:hypothetical protein
MLFETTSLNILGKTLRRPAVRRALARLYAEGPLRQVGLHFFGRRGDARHALIRDDTARVITRAALARIATTGRAGTFISPRPAVHFERRLAMSRGAPRNSAMVSGSKYIAVRTFQVGYGV